VQPDVIDLRSFYASPLGRVAQRMILRAIRTRWTSLQGLALLGHGYAIPYLDDLREGTERTIAFMPARQGVAPWPRGMLSAVSLVEGSELPLRDSVMDRVVLVHSLEVSDDPSALMSEIWRILAPGGHVMIIVPNRRGPWARMDTTPFGAADRHGVGKARREPVAALRRASRDRGDEAGLSPGPGGQDGPRARAASTGARADGRCRSRARG